MHNQFYRSFIENFGYEPTKNQLTVIGELTDFMLLPVKRHLFVLKGYAGTGKTSLVGALVKTLPQISYDSVLLAPTGRAAKVLANYSGKPAFTIHKMIYHLRSGGDGYTRFVLQPNKFQNTVFLVDEASMIGDGGGLSSKNWGEAKSLLDDLLEFVYSGINCKLMLIGDTAQLPPVGMEISPALDEDALYKKFMLNIEFNELSEVVRQAENSEILFNATHLREQIAAKKINLPLFQSVNKADVKTITGLELEDALNDAYAKYGDDNVMLITRSNKRANQFNLQIRARIKWLEDELAAGDLMMIVKNNYFWLQDSSKAGFIANGDIVELLKIRGEENMYGFRFANVVVRMVDYPDQPDLEVKILLDSILTEAPSLS
ncbi:MAG: AAA family ATPase, partial [Flavobacteriales bacterium]|nr:AAA family ATPase [Flavobacteriales bacterium]